VIYRTGSYGIDFEEVVADVFVRMYLACSGFRFRGEPAFRGWVRTVTRNSIRKAMRARPRRPGSIETAPEPDDGGAGDPLRVLLLQEEMGSLMKARCLLLLICLQGLSQAPASGQEALGLHVFSGLTFKEIAGKVGRTPCQVAGLVRRTREKIIEHLVRTLGYWR